jgi:hypothetical protein
VEVLDSRHTVRFLFLSGNGLREKAGGGAGGGGGGASGSEGARGGGS